MWYILIPAERYRLARQAGQLQQVINLKRLLKKCLQQRRRYGKIYFVVEREKIVL